MATNVVVLEGRLPFFEPNYQQGDDQKKSRYFGAISVKRNYKPDGEKYYPEDLLPFRAFGKNADFISKYFEAGDGISIVGTLQMGEDYEDKNGDLQKGKIYILVKEIHFPEMNNSSNAEGNSNNNKKSNKEQKSKSSKSNNPLLNNKNRNKGKMTPPWAK